MGQDLNGLVLEYNLYTNEITYKRDGIITLKPSLKENENLNIIVTEFNPYIMKADLNIIELDYNQSSSELSYGDYDGKGGGGNLSGITGLLGGLNLGSSIQQSFGGIPGSRGVSSDQMEEAKSKFSILTEELSATEKEMNYAHEKIQLFETMQKGQELALDDIERLKTNELLRPSRIRELIEEEVNHAFAKRSDEPIDIHDLINQMKSEEDLNAAVDQYKLASKKYVALANDWKLFAASLVLSEEDLEDMQIEYIKSASDSVSMMMDKNIQLKLNKTVEVKLPETYTKTNLIRMAALRQTYEELNSNIFSYSFPPVQAKGDEVNFEIVVKQKRGVPPEYKSYKNLAQTVPVTGGWKISAGLGMAFGVLTTKNYNYSVVNKTIVGDELDDFSPLIVSFAHAYKKSTKSLNVGGSFGVGFPLQGGSGIESVAFFLGPTILLGKQQKFLITFGLMGAKVNRLSSGFKAGDAWDSLSSTLPTVQKYETGYFLGISYDLLR